VRRTGMSAGGNINIFVQLYSASVLLIGNQDRFILDKRRVSTVISLLGNRLTHQMVSTQRHGLT
jgi:hypothetical protein